MGDNAYTNRLNENDVERTGRNQRQLLRAAGLPIQRPTSPGDVVSPSGVPVGQAPIPQQDESYKDSIFYQNFDYHRQNDPHFDSTVGELTKLATGLREQVNNGFMPPAIAEQRIHQFVTDTVHGMHVKEPQIKAQQARQTKDAQMMQMIGALQQGASQGAPDQSAPQEVPPEGITPEQQQSGNFVGGQS